MRLCLLKRRRWRWRRGRMQVIPKPWCTCRLTFWHHLYHERICGPCKDKNNQMGRAAGLGKTKLEMKHGRQGEWTLFLVGWCTGNMDLRLVETSVHETGLSITLAKYGMCKPTVKKDIPKAPIEVWTYKPIECKPCGSESAQEETNTWAQQVLNVTWDTFGLTTCWQMMPTKKLQWFGRWRSFFELSGQIFQLLGQKKAQVRARIERCMLERQLEMWVKNRMRKTFGSSHKMEASGPKREEPCVFCFWSWKMSFETRACPDVSSNK